MTQRSPLIALRNIHKHFDGFELNDVNLDILPGEVHVLVGENGSGKSMLMKLIAGWFLPDAGTVFYRGEKVRFRSVYEARKRGILYLHQEVQSFENLSVAENVFFGCIPGLWGLPSLVDRNRMLSECRNIFRELDIHIEPSVCLGSLGYAERQLVAAIRGYVFGAQLLVLDEPSSSMGEHDRAVLFDIVTRLKARGTGIFYVSHRMDEIQRVGNRVSVMHRGCIRTTGDCSTVSPESLVEMMTGEVQRERYPRLGFRKGQVVLKVTGLTVDSILKGVNLTLHRGEILGVTGLTGSGRTLLANCLFGIVKPAGGRMEIQGKETTFNHPGDAMAKGISLIPEDRCKNGIFYNHDLIHNITSAALPRFRRRGVLDERFMIELTHEYVKEMSIRPGNTGDIMENYSGGNQQKVMVSRWLMRRSRIYIMDEPTKGIDAASKVDIYNTMNDMVEKGASIILISSEIEEILGMSDRILVLAGGRIAAEMNREEASKERILDYAVAEG